MATNMGMGLVVNRQNLSGLKSLSLCFLLAGLAGLILSTVISTRYMNALPRYPDLQNQRMTPRNISGYIVYQNEQEDRALTVVEYSSVLTFLTGLGTGLVYVRKGGLARAIESGEDEFLPEES